jgi:class 3 adenylate cyclase
MLDSYPDNEKRLANNSWLRSTIEQIEATGWAAEIYDAQWRLLWISEEMKVFLDGETKELDGQSVGYGLHMLEVYGLEPWQNILTDESFKSSIETGLPFVAFDTPVPLETIPGPLVESFRPVIAKTEPQSPPPFYSTELELLQDGLPPVKINCMHTRIYDANQQLVGTAKIYGPGMRSSLLNLVTRGDPEMFERMIRLVNPGRQSVAIMFADLRGSTKLSRELSDAAYWRLITSLTKAMDDVVVKHNGIVGKHSGDGISAFFLTDDHQNSISKTIYSLILAAREIREKTVEVSKQAARDVGLKDDSIDAQMKIGLHWGSNVFMGQIVSGGRLEVTALGEEVNDCARIEESASGNQILASKSLLERLRRQDAERLSINVAAKKYRILSEISAETDKAVRDQINIPVTEL